MNTKHILILLVFLIPICSWAQAPRITLDKNIKQSSLIVEAEIVSSEPFRHKGDYYTKHALDVTKIYKGVLPEQPIFIVTCGGQIGDEGSFCSHTLQLGKGTEGIFFLIPAIDTPSEQYFQAYNGQAGGLLKYKYNAVGEKIATAHFDQPELELVTDIEQQIAAITGQVAIDLTDPAEAVAAEGTGLRFTVKNFFFSSETVDFDVFVNSINSQSFRLAAAKIEIEHENQLGGISDAELTQGQYFGPNRYAVALQAPSPNKRVLQLSANALNSFLPLSPHRKKIKNRYCFRIPHHRILQHHFKF